MWLLMIYALLRMMHIYIWEDPTDMDDVGVPLF